MKPTPPVLLLSFGFTFLLLFLFWPLEVGIVPVLYLFSYLLSVTVIGALNFLLGVVDEKP